MSEQKSFWTTLPGILTGLAAVVGALASLIIALNTQQNGVNGDPNGPEADRKGTFHVVGIEHKRGKKATGMYFSFRLHDVDGILGRESWSNEQVRIENTRTGRSGPARIWRGPAAPEKALKDTGHGRWDDGTAAAGQWQVDDEIALLEW